MGGYSWKENSSFSFAIRYSPLAHEEACEAGPSVHFFLILQAFNGFCKLSVNRGPTYQIRQRNVTVILPLKQNQNLEGEVNCFFWFFFLLSFTASYIAFYFLYPPFPFLLFCFLFKIVFTSAMPCHAMSQLVLICGSTSRSFLTCLTPGKMLTCFSLKGKER